jgi:hypothetical protein
MASHYAEPASRQLRVATTLRSRPAGEAILELGAGADFDMLEDSRGWAWGYAGADRRVGYVPSEALSNY